MTSGQIKLMEYSELDGIQRETRVLKKAPSMRELWRPAPGLAVCRRDGFWCFGMSANGAPATICAPASFRAAPWAAQRFMRLAVMVWATIVRSRDVQIAWRGVWLKSVR